MTQAAPTDHETLLTAAEVERRVGLSHSTIYTEMREGRFPLPLKMPGGRAVRWRASEIEDWINSLPRAVGDLAKESQ